MKSENLIDELGGIEAARETLKDILQFDWGSFDERTHSKWTSAKNRLERAIHDHESIYGGGDD